MSKHTKTILCAFSILSLIGMIRFSPPTPLPQITNEGSIKKKGVHKVSYFPEHTMQVSAEHSLLSKDCESLHSPQIRVLSSSEPYTLKAQTGTIDHRLHTIFFPKAHVEYNTYSANLQKASIDFKKSPSLQCRHAHIEETND